VVFVERGVDALGVGGEGGECWGVRGGREVEVRVEGLRSADEGRDLECWEEEGFEEKVERVVRSLERETGWVAPRWRVLEPRRDPQLSEVRKELQTSKKKEEALVVKMREMFGHEDFSNAV